MSDAPLEEVVEEREFAAALLSHGDAFFRLANTLARTPPADWRKKHHAQLISEAQALESFLDDYGARENRTYGFFTELVASVRGFALAAHSLAHLNSRLGTYGLDAVLSADDFSRLADSIQGATAFVAQAIGDMLEAAGHESTRLGLKWPSEALEEEAFVLDAVRKKLPRNVGLAEVENEHQRIAEVVSRFLQACDMLNALRVQPVADPERRRAYLAIHCTEVRARLLESTVHNLQSAYDTYIKNTRAESQDPRLLGMRGHASAGLHLLSAVTCLTHFYERHENDIRSESAKLMIAMIVDRAAVQACILNQLLCQADQVVRAYRSCAIVLLKEYTNAQEVTIELGPDLELHARPASLIVGIVNHFGTPVEVEIAGTRANAGSILELLVAIGSNPGVTRFVFHGDQQPLRDIELLFQHGLGEDGIDSLPERLAYLQRR
jgi:phosphotransferase system HPr-like phosphotransfer protein